METGVPGFIFERIVEKDEQKDEKMGPFAPIEPDKGSQEKPNALNCEDKRK